MKEYLVKVRYALSGLKVYKVETDNIYRIVGKIYCTSIEHIKRIDYSTYTPENEQFWVDEGYKVNGYIEPILSEEKPDYCCHAECKDCAMSIFRASKCSDCVNCYRICKHKRR